MSEDDNLSAKYVIKMRKLGFDITYNYQLPTRQEILMVMILEELKRFRRNV